MLKDVQDMIQISILLSEYDVGNTNITPTRLTFVCRCRPQADEIYEILHWQFNAEWIDRAEPNSYEMVY